MTVFANLHQHFQFSLLDGFGSADQILARAKETGYETLAVTDHGTLAGCPQFSKAAHKYGIKPILGLEAYFIPGSIRDTTSRRREDITHLTLLAKSSRGYLNLSHLSSLSHLEGFYYRPRLDFEQLARYSEDVICLSGCAAGLISKYIKEDRYDDALRTAQKFAEIFGNNFYLEIQPEVIREQHKINSGIKRIGDGLGLPFTLTLDSHYPHPTHSRAHDALLCIQTGQHTYDTDRKLKFDEGQYYLKSQEEVAALPQATEFKDCLVNTLKIADECDFAFDKSKVYMPEINLDRDHLEEFNSKIEDGLHKKSDIIEFNGIPLQEYKNRIEEERDTIIKTGFLDYFLIVEDIVRYAKSNDMLVGPGRGSVGASVIAWLLGITADVIDPLYFGFNFARFLDEGRANSRPDIDLDFCHKDRDRIIKYVEQKYGEDHVARIGSYSKIQARAAIKDVGRVLGVPFNVTNYISSLIPKSQRTKTSLAEAIQQIPALQEARDQHQDLFDLAIQIEGTPRHATVHPAGIVITPNRVIDCLPLFLPRRGDDQKPTTQYDKDEVEELGYVKVDILAIETLDQLDSANRAIGEEEGERINLYDLPLEDKKTYDLIKSGRVNGVFQLNTNWSRRVIADYQPEKLEDLAMVNGLARPGAERSYDHIIKCRRGEAEPKFAFHILEDVLKDTYGGLVFQEDLIATVAALTGLPYSDCDKFRKACGKKDAKLMEEQRAIFLKHGVQQGHDESKLEKMFDILRVFGEYGFSKIHGLEYSYIGYQTAYLKAHYPAYFMAALMTSDSGDHEKLTKHIAEAKELGIKMLDLDINESSREFKAVGPHQIRYGFSILKGFGDATFDVIDKAKGGVDEKSRYGKYFTAIPKEKELVLRVGEGASDFDLKFLKAACHKNVGNSRVIFRFENTEAIVRTKLFVDEGKLKDAISKLKSVSVN